MGALIPLLVSYLPDIVKIARVLLTKGQSAQQKAVPILEALSDAVALATKHPEYALHLQPLIAQLTDDLSIVAELTPEERVAMRAHAEDVFAKHAAALPVAAPEAA